MLHFIKLERRVLLLFITIISAFLMGLFLKDKVNALSDYLKFYLFILVFCVGTTTNLSNLIACVKNKKKMIAYLVMLRFLLAPLIGLGVAYLFRLNQEFSVGLLYLSIVPSAMMASVISNMFGGDININVLATCFMILITPIIVPLLGVIYLQSLIAIQVIDLFIKLLINFVLPLLLGSLLNKLITERGYKPWMNAITMLAVAMIISVTTARASQIILSSQVIHIMLTLLFYFATLYFVATLILRKYRRTLPEFIAGRNELCLNDCALSSVLASLHSLVAAVPSALAALLQIIFIVIMNTASNKLTLSKALSSSV
jgi:BASS family bile acid:Na+ symporter